MRLSPLCHQARPSACRISSGLHSFDDTTSTTLLSAALPQCPPQQGTQLRSVPPVRHHAQRRLDEPREPLGFFRGAFVFLGTLSGSREGEALFTILIFNARAFPSIVHHRLGARATARDVFVAKGPVASRRRRHVEPSSHGCALTADVTIARVLRNFNNVFRWMEPGHGHSLSNFGGRVMPGPEAENRHF